MRDESVERRAAACEARARHEPIASATGPLSKLTGNNALLHIQRTRVTHTRLAQINRHFTAPLRLKHVALRAKIQAILYVNTPTMPRDNDHSSARAQQKA